LNDLGSTESTAYLLKYDSVHGTWAHSSTAEGDFIVLRSAKDGRVLRVPYSRAKEPAALASAYKAAGVALVLVRVVLCCCTSPAHMASLQECTGVFLTRAALAPYFEACAVAKVVVSAPVKDSAAPVLNVVMGCNADAYRPGEDHIVTAASCTTNCLAPVVKVIHESLGIVHGCITTIHNITNTQTLLDAPNAKKSDLRRARSGLVNLAPTSTGSATAIALIFPELKGKLNGLAVRVPLTNSSITDCVFEVKRTTTVEEVNGLLAAAAEGPLQGILGFETATLVSTDYVNDTRSSIVDAECTQVIDGTMVKIYAWYDSTFPGHDGWSFQLTLLPFHTDEMGYSCRLVDLARLVAAHM
jgi:glyceraldehyde 3-phosphate dehydrogenase